MIDFDRFKKRFLQFGGWRLVFQYARMGVLWTGCVALLRCIIRGKSLKQAYPTITKKVDKILVTRYKYILNDYKKNVLLGNYHNIKTSCVPKIVWFSWLQGIETAPILVKVCLESQKLHLHDYEFRILDFNNYHQWVQLPQYVVDKYRKGIIPSASFSDLIRLAVLKKYGGIWMDATVYCSGFGNDNLKKRWEKIMHSELTIFRYFKQGINEPIGLSTWFFSVVPHNIIISVALDMLLAYWKDFNCLIDYYIIHLFLELTLSEFPDVVSNMPHENSSYSLFLANVLRNDYKEKDWINMTKYVSIHKLNYRKVEEAMKNPHSYCSYIINKIDI